MANILIGLTGSIACYKTCELISMLKKRGHCVKCMMTEAAARFVTPLTLETLTGEKAVTGMFDLPNKRSPEHIALAEWADIVLIAPASADIIARISCGLCDDIVSCTVCSTPKPVLFAPAMNDRMFNNPMVRQNVKKLKNAGYHFTGPVRGMLACGREGIGHIAPVEEIASEAEEILKKSRE
jgi:phosphopantothenoylcysteine decarboxylase/phosphopantothenate--cysteine ligase